MQEETIHRPVPWLTAGFDWEGIVAAAGAFLVAMLLGWLWPPLFWIGFVAVVLALMSSRWSFRAPPEFADGILAPCDGVVVSVEHTDVPLDLRLDTPRATRVRIASAPSVTNKLYSPINGGVESLSLDAGDPAVPFATRPDEAGLARASLIFESQGQQVAMKIATGGLGPRLEMAVAEGDVVRLGRSIGTRRLGGWCDLYIPEGASATAWPGQTLIGGETVIGRFLPDIVEADFKETEVEAEPAMAVEDETDVREPPDEVDELFEETPEEDDDLKPEDFDTIDDPAVIFARIREAARKHGESD